MSLRSLFGQIAVYGVSDALIKLLGIVTVVVYTRVFSPTEYGVISLVGALVGLLNTAAGLGISSAVQRDYFSAREVRRSTIVSTGYWGVLGSSGSVTALGLALAPLFAWKVFGSTEHVGLIAVALLAIPFVQLVAYCQDVIRMHFRPWCFTAIAFLNQAGQVACGVTLVGLFGLGLYGMFIGILIGVAVAFVFSTVSLARELRWRFSSPMFRRYVRYGVPLVFGGLAFPAFLFVDRIILEYFQGAAAVGHLSVALSVAQSMGLISGSFSKAWNAVAWKLRHQHAQYRRIYADLLLYLIAIFAVAAVGIAAFAPEIVAILAPPAFADASIAVAPLTIYMLANVSIQITAAGISISGRTFYLSMVIWIAVIGNIVLDIALIPLWGIFGAALATAIAEALMSIGLAAVGQRLHPLPYDYSRLFGCVGLLAIFLALSYLLQPGWSLLAIALKLGFIALFGGLLVSTTIVSLKRLMRTAVLVSGTDSPPPDLPASGEVEAQKVSV